MPMRLKLDEADRVFSHYIRLRDGMCMRCELPVYISPDTGLPKSHEASHFFGRVRETTRFDTRNVDTLCTGRTGYDRGCHKIWEKEERGKYREFKIKQLGQDEFNALYALSQKLKKKDRKLELIIARELLKTVL